MVTGDGTKVTIGRLGPLLAPQSIEREQAKYRKINEQVLNLLNKTC